MGSWCPKIQDVFCVELRMNRPSYDEYEEVESPFASKATDKPSSRLRTRKNVFNRPFATDSSNAPTYIETSPTSTRRAIGHADNTDLIDTRQSSLAETEIEYLEEEEEEEEVERRPARSPSTSSKKKDKLKKNILQKIGWSVIGLLVLRLICMDRESGIISPLKVISERSRKNFQVFRLKTKLSRLKSLRFRSIKTIKDNSQKSTLVLLPRMNF
jgi:hypothetical protein